LKEIRKILVFLVSAALLGALIAPWLYWGGKWGADRWGWQFLREAGFRQFFDRAVLLAAVALLWPALRSLKIHRLAEIGIERDPRGWPHLAIGFATGLLCMAVFGFILIKLGVYRLRSDPQWLALIKIALSAFSVAVLEEWFFRGVIFGFFRRALLDPAALFCTSALFSVVHFLKPPAVEGLQIDWLAGFRVLPSCFEKFAEPALLGAGFTTLFLFGWVLGWAVLRTRALWLSVGLHAGLVFGKFGFNKVTKRLISDTMPWLGEDIVVGLAALAVVATVWLLAWMLISHVDAKSRAPRW
jgi:membrane protease YdiL (CAAX protease family)